MTDLLSVDGLDAGYGDFQALFDLTLRVAEGETVAIIGANGAGKTTLLRAVAGLVRASGGGITFAGQDLLILPAHKRVGLGIALVPEGRRLFPSLSVRENLLIGGHAGRRGNWTLDSVLELFPLLKLIQRRSSATLSGGEQQMVAIGRALMSNPRLVLLDEVSLGLAPTVVKDLYAALPTVVSGGMTAVVVEQDIGQALSVADRVYCMLEGRVSLQGRPDELDHSQITTAYFGM